MRENMEEHNSLEFSEGWAAGVKDFRRGMYCRFTIIHSVFASGYYTAYEAARQDSMAENEG